ncbi:hypothetical protein L1987_25397 [Smallanthus sonchifolius]|uniref:Uncharacterized protein n=1 Tax=Smallanthus sonchifolius TaxID=185202 RepID=A0ACB9IPK2_9ASTR|nr:hypothetical protein L1987_25397 [Smallanthus sonchifolius]
MLRNFRKDGFNRNKKKDGNQSKKLMNTLKFKIKNELSGLFFRLITKRIEDCGGVDVLIGLAEIFNCLSFGIPTWRNTGGIRHYRE